MKRLVILAAWLTVVPATLAAGADFEARLWMPDVSGTVRVGSGAAAGSTIDLTRELGLDEDGMVEGRLIFRPSRRLSLRFDYATLSLAGNARIDRTVMFGGQSFQLDDRVVSAVDLDYGRIGLAWQFLSNPDGSLRFGPLVEIKGLRGAASLSTELLGILPVSAREEFEVAFGAAGVALDVEPSRKLAIFAEWTTLVSADEGDLTDAELGIRFSPVPVLALTAGYRILEIDAEDRGDLLALDLDGLFFGAAVRF